MPSCSASFFNSSVVLRDFTLRMTLIPEDVFFTVIEIRRFFCKGVGHGRKASENTVFSAF